MRLGVFGRGRLGTALREVASDAIVWQVGREPLAGQQLAGVDVLIDVSTAAALEEHLAFALGRGTPLVIGTTGWAMPDLAQRVGERIGVVVAPNFSLTVAFLTELVRQLGRFAVLDEAADLYIAEHHHARKKDAPSGTALALAQALLASCPRKTSWTLAPADRPLRPDELSIAVLRAGHTASSHTVGLDLPGEAITLTHMARDLSPYARGSIAAATWIRPRTGVYTMADVARDYLAPVLAGNQSGG